MNPLRKIEVVMGHWKYEAYVPSLFFDNVHNTDPVYQFSEIDFDTRQPLSIGNQENNGKIHIIKFHPELAWLKTYRETE